MSVLERFLRVIRANINGLIAESEDPETILEQAVSDMQEDLILMRQAVASAIATQKRSERQATQNETIAGEWYRRAEIALAQGDEALAKEALSRRQSYAEIYKSLQSQIQQQVGTIEKLKIEMRSLEYKISQAKAKKDMYIARARSAEAASRIRETIGKSDASVSNTAFERMEEKVIELEAQSELMKELSTDDVERRFAALEKSQTIENQLAQLKASQGKIPHSCESELRNSSKSASEASVEES